MRALRSGSLLDLALTLPLLAPFALEDDERRARMGAAARRPRLQPLGVLGLPLLIRWICLLLPPLCPRVRLSSTLQSRSFSLRLRRSFMNAAQLSSRGSSSLAGSGSPASQSTYSRSRTSAAALAFLPLAVRALHVAMAAADATATDATAGAREDARVLGISVRAQNAWGTIGGRSHLFCVSEQGQSWVV